jgi:hypothetical protein
MKRIVDVKLPKTKAELVQALSGTTVKRMHVDVVAGMSIASDTSKKIAEWRRGKNTVVVVALEIGASQ